jgi:protein TonB
MKSILSLAFIVLLSSTGWSQISVREMPQYPGGDVALIQDISNNIIYPDAERTKRTEGVVMIEFTIEEDGSVVNPIVKRGIEGAPELDNAALQAVTKLQKFTPAKEAGKPRAMSYVVPIKFALTQ